MIKTDFPIKPLPFPNKNDIDARLALLGGNPIIQTQYRKTIFPNITKEDIFQMLLSAQGDSEGILNEFCNKYKDYVGANYAILTASGTSSLQLALIGAGVKPGDEVIVPAFTFIATAQAIVAAKAIPIFADIDPLTYCIDPIAVKKHITPRTKAIMPVHVHGLPANMDLLREVCTEHNLYLIEDASHAHSAKYKNQVCGSIGDAAGQSLMADKNFPVGGEGGIAFFKHEESYRRALAFLESTGIDYRMSWIVASFGMSQLDRLPYYDEIRQRNAGYLASELRQTGLFLPPHVPNGLVHSYNMYRMKLTPENLGLDDIPIYKIKLAVQELLVAEGVPAREWQNMPIPGHLPFKNQIGYGNGYPFNLANQSLNYSIYAYPNVLRMLESTLVLCREMRSPVEYERIQSYANAFKKIAKNPSIIREIANKQDNKKPYETSARLG